MASSSADPPLKVYIASIIGNTEIRKQVQRTLFILQSLQVPFRSIDITVRGNQDERSFMQENALNKRQKGVPLPPQFFHKDEYIGNYMDFEEAVEDNALPEFLRLVPSASSQKGTSEEPEDEDEEESEEGEDEAEGEDEEEDEAEGEAEADEEDEQEDEQEDEEVTAVTVTLPRLAANDGEGGEEENEAEGEEEDEAEGEEEDEEYDEEGEDEEEAE